MYSYYVLLSLFITISFGQRFPFINYDYGYGYDYDGWGNLIRLEESNTNNKLEENIQNYDFEKEHQFQPDDIVCRNEMTGEALDWFTLYKLPKKSQVLETSKLTNPFIYNGTAYTTITSKAQTQWKMSELSMNDTRSFPGKTLEILYKTKFN